jgi:acid phosphatase
MLIPRIAVVPVFFVVVFCLLLSFGFDYKMRVRSFVAASVAFATTSNAQTQYTSTGTAAVAAAKATAKTLSPTSSVPGKSFDRFVNIWLENTDFEMAAGDRTPLLSYFVSITDINVASLSWLASQGITLTNYLAITHPSQPNYIASVGGSNHWVIWDLFSRISSSEKTIVDLLDAKGVSWSEYEEDMPYSGFEGDYVNQVNGANDYVRKHK